MPCVSRDALLCRFQSPVRGDRCYRRSWRLGNRGQCPRRSKTLTSRNTPPKSPTSQRLMRAKMRSNHSCKRCTRRGEGKGTQYVSRDVLQMNAFSPPKRTEYLPSVERLGIGDGVLEGAKARIAESPHGNFNLKRLSSGTLWERLGHYAYAALCGWLGRTLRRLQKRTAMQVQFEATKKRAAIALGDKWEEVATIGLAREFSLGMGEGGKISRPYQNDPAFPRKIFRAETGVARRFLPH